MTLEGIQHGENIFNPTKELERFDGIRISYDPAEDEIMTSERKFNGLLQQVRAAIERFKQHERTAQQTRDENFFKEYAKLQQLKTNIERVLAQIAEK